MTDYLFVYDDNNIFLVALQAAGAHTKPLTAKHIQAHLEAVGLEAEFALHSHIRGLSGGQKVKVVLAAAMWNNPHMLVLVS